MAGGQQSGGAGTTESGEGFVPGVLAPIMKIVGLGLATRGGALGPMLAASGDYITNARDERLKRDVWAQIMPEVLAGVQRTREVPGTGKPAVPGKPAAPGTPGTPDMKIPIPFLAGVPRPTIPMAPQEDGTWVSAEGKPSESPAPYESPIALPGQAATPGTPGTPDTPAVPPTVRRWETPPTMSEALARLQAQGGPPPSRALALEYLTKLGLPATEQIPAEYLKEIEQRNTLSLQQGAQATEEARLSPIFAGALEPNATTAARGAAAAAGMGGIHPPTQAEQIQLQEIRRRREIGATLAQQLRAQAQTVGTTPSPTIEAPGATGLPPFSAFQPTAEQRRNRMMMIAAAAESGDPAAITEAQKVIGGPETSVHDVLQYGQAAHAIRPPEITLTPERIKLIASGEIVDPRLTQAGAKKVLATDEASAIRVAGAKATATAQGRESGTPGITQDALDLAADNYLTTRQLPAMGMGGVAQRVRIMNRAAQMAQERGIPFNDIPQRQAAFKAAQSELSQLQAQRGKVMAFADTADKNLDMALQMSARVPRTGIPQLNAWLQTGQTKWTGDPALAAFAAATRVGVNETAKVTSGQVSGVSTDTARKEIEGMLNTAQTPDQFREVVETLRLDMANRKAGYMGQIDEIHRGMRSLSGAPGPGEAASPPASAGQPSPSAPPSGGRSVRVRDTKTGRTGTAALAPGQSLPAGVVEVK